MHVEGKVIFITGANRGIGKSLVQAALQLGANKVYASARHLDAVQPWNDSRVSNVRLDITDEDQIKQAAILATDTQILINNAGIITPGDLLTSKSEHLRKDMEVNYFGTISLMKASVPILEQNQPATLINIASISAYTNFPLIAGYSASKAALYSATQAARIELSKRGITVHAVNPGAIDTDMNKGSTMKMTSPNEVALSILQEMELGTLDIVPDKIGLYFYAKWREDPSPLAAITEKMYFGEWDGTID